MKNRMMVPLIAYSSCWYWLGATRNDLNLWKRLTLIILTVVAGIWVNWRADRQ